MPVFSYRAKQGPDEIREGVIEASSESEAVERIYQMGLTPVLVRQNTASAQEGQIRFSAGTRIRGKMLVSVIQFSRHLASLVRSGVPMFKAIRLLAEQETHQEFRKALISIGEDIQKGKSFSQAVAAHPEAFSRMYAATIYAGEVSGKLQDGLERISVYLGKQEAMDSRVRRALVYPVFLLCAGFASILFILSFAVPKFEKVFSQMGRALPWPTQLVMDLGKVMQHGWFLVLFAMVLMFLLAPALLRKVFGELFWDRWVLRLPWIGGMTARADFSRFLRALELCLSGGLVFLDALKVAVYTVQNSVIRESLSRASRAVEKGGLFSRALKEEEVFQGFASHLIAIGEESGKLNEVVLEMADSYDKEMDEKMAYLTTLLEPVLILGIGAVVAFIVFAMLLPIFEINTMI